MMITIDDFASYKKSFTAYLIDKSSSSSSSGKSKYSELSSIIIDSNSLILQTIDGIQRNATVLNLLKKFIVKYNKNKLAAKYYDLVQPSPPDDDAAVEDEVTSKKLKKKAKSKKRQVSEEVAEDEERDTHNDISGKQKNGEKSKKSKRTKSSISDDNINAVSDNDDKTINKSTTTIADQQQLFDSNYVVAVNNQAENESKVVEKVWPTQPTTGNVTILLFYAYCPNGPMSRAQQDAAIAFCYGTLNKLGVTGRLRIAREGYNATLTGTYESIRSFTTELRRYSKETFQHTDFKYVDHLPDNQLLKGLKVWPVTEIVTYGFDPKDAPLEKRGQHLLPKDFHEAMMDPNVVVIDVRNFNETVIGKFAPPPVVLGDNEKNNVVSKVLDPCMRRSTEFPDWVKRHKQELEGKKVLMYCTAGVRCERASSFLRNQGIDDVYQLDGGVHRYLEEFPENGGFWVGKNYTFDKRFNHGASNAMTISKCVYCDQPWDRYQAQRKCGKCSMECLLCKECQKVKPNIPTAKLICPLCK